MPGSSEDRLPSQGRPKPKRKRREPTYTTDHPTRDERHEVHKIVRNPPKGLEKARKAAAGVGKATARGARRVSDAADAGPIHRALTEPRPKATPMAFSGRSEVAPPSEPAWIRETISHKPFHYEDVSDFALGKAATNLLFHGDTSHPGAAALEIGSMLPIFRGARSVDELIHAGRTAKAVEGVADVLPAAKKARKAQEAGYSAERGKRIRKGTDAFRAVGGGEAGLNALSGELKGELPKVGLNVYREGDVPQQVFDDHLNAIWDHPGLNDFQKKSAMSALRDLRYHGTVPQERQIQHLATVFGPEETTNMLHRSLGERVWDVMGASRSLKSSLDLSATGRQLLVALARHPVLVTKASVPAQLKTLFSPKNYDALIQSLHDMPEYGEMHDIAKLKFTELHPTKIREREEMYPSPWIEKNVRVKGVDVNVPGMVVRASGRAFTAARDVSLATVYLHQKELMAKAGIDVTNPDELRAIGKVINSATGRGELGKAESWAPALNALFFAPSLAKSRIDFLNPFWYKSLTPYARRQAIRSMVQLGAAVTGLLAAGTYLGGKVGHDPRSADFAKLKVGNSRIDPLGGFQQYLRLMAQLTPEKAYGGKTWQGVTVSSATGKRKTMGHGFGDPTRLDSILTFLQSKAAPPVGLFLDISRGTDLTGQPVTAKREALGMVTPLVMQDTAELYGDKHSAKLAAIGYLVSGLGVGLQTYGNPSIAKQKADFKEWHKQADSTWQKLYHMPVPMVAVRAKQDQIAVEALTRDASDDSERINILTDYIVKNRPHLAQYESHYRRLAPTPGNVSALRNLIYGGVLSQVQTQMNAYERAHK